ncbi:MAG: YebC/PmpR family DNA-binding transcriptional regulator [Erysipelotrichaceae bacterium]|jgi:YebC/PmpR family DNA-binding regulatory protein|nr:YebC/PmpR family DNA-binding transcriptional regulator [Erysipelotrichaceae bacterium]
MGRAHEVRAKAMAATAAARSALFMRASKEIYMAAKSGEPDPDMNLALRSAIEKWKGQNVTKDVIERAIQKAKGGSAESYTSGLYEAFGPGNSYFIIESLTDNTNRALTEIRTAITKKGGHLGTVAYNFTQYGVLAFKGNNRDEVEETLILGDVDVNSVTEEDGVIEVLVSPTDFGKARDVLSGMGVKEFDVAEISYIPNEYIEISDPEDRRKFDELCDMLDELQDVQNVYHNVK